MRSCLSHILCLAVLLTSLAACSKEAMSEGNLPMGNTAEKRTVTLNFNVGTKAAASGAAAEVEPPKDLNIWVYADRQTDKPLLYKRYDGLNWLRVEGEAGQEQTEYYAALSAVEVEGVQEISTRLKVYAVVNTTELTWSGTSDFENISEAGLRALGFSEIKTSAHDNSVPMFGETVVEMQAGEHYYSTSMTVRRCLAKLELFFTRNTSVFDLTINRISLSQAPQLGYLAVPEDLNALGGAADAGNMYEGVIQVAAILERDKEAGNFSAEYEQDNSCFVPASLSRPYIFERRGLAWTSGIGPDDVYPGAEAPDAYRLTVDYTMADGGTTETIVKDIYLSAIERNTCYRIFVRISRNSVLEVNTRVIPWVEGEGEYTFDVTPGLPVEGNWN